jgi:hypothetical protein
MFELLEFLEVVFGLFGLARPRSGKRAARHRLASRKNRLFRLARPPAGPVAISFGFAVVGAIAGVGSLLVFPDPVIADPKLRLLSLLVSPVAAGLATTVLGARHDQLGEKRFQLEHFVYGFVAILTMGLLRALVAR